ncbi:MAG: beta-galactosidase trimerization domain-containing protein [Acutalibacteraceae bacterium]
MLPYRQVHLDFHTSEKIPGVGVRFSRDNFAQALKEGHIDSITLFAKCHHGWSYFDSAVNARHPGLDFDLLDEQLEVCRELGVRTQIYISAGLDEHYAREHAECICAGPAGTPSLLYPGYHRLCLGTPYLDKLAAETEEVMRCYAGKFDGVFFDIVEPTPCLCEYCIQGMEAQGLDPQKAEDRESYARQVYFRYTERVKAAVFQYAPGMAIFHNGGHIPRGDRKIAFCNTRHLELESLPTGGWGYDHFPLSAAYARTLGREFLGMTGKFHKSWGEFGGFKHPNALRYEAALAAACGGRCSVGDQLHPDGQFDLATYRLIGQAYAELEQKEPWLAGADNVADVALLSAEAFSGGRERNLPSDAGANRILLEGHYLYDVIDCEADFSRYKLLILPDDITLEDEGLRQKIAAFAEKGGRLLLSGRSGTADGVFALDFGVRFGGKAAFVPSYLQPVFELPPNGSTCYVMYSQSYVIEPQADFSGEVTAMRVDPYFNRGYGHFCSHQHTPYDRERVSPAVVIAGNTAYIAWDIFAEYAQQGSLHLKNMVIAVLDRLLGRDKSFETSLGAYGVTTLTAQPQARRLVNHLLYAVPRRRGDGVEIIEDIQPVYGTQCALRLEKEPKRVYLAPQGEDLLYAFSDGVLRYTVEHFSCHAMVAIELGEDS